MPYIPQDGRDRYSDSIDDIANKLSCHESDEWMGEAAYVITQIILQTPIQESWRNWAKVIGTLESVKMELYRRWVAPYEDKAIERNGDL
jgi:hypothetical protein